jgi:Recombination, repair and ssDNA binding protein UvsY
MDIETLYNEWAKDGEIDQANISKSTTDIPKLHNKYFRWYVEEGLKLKKLKAEYKILYKLKGEWYRGELDDEELKEHGWQPQRLKILRADVPAYLESDADIIKMSLKIGFQEEIVAYLESIIKHISNRNFLLKTIVDWERFRTGA